MKSIHAAGVASLLIATVTMAAPAAESQFPTRPIRLLVPQAAGGSNDIMARNVANHLTQTFGKQVVVDNRPGAEGIIGTEIVARSAPDGYTLLLASAAFTMNPAVRKLPYDSLAAFDWVAKLGSGPTVLTVGPLLPVGTVKEILAIGKEKPGVVTMASAGGFQHFRHRAVSQPLRCRFYDSAVQRRLPRDDRRDGRPVAHDRGLDRAVNPAHPLGQAEADRDGRRDARGDAAGLAHHRRGRRAGLRREQLVGGGGAGRNARSDDSEAQRGDHGLSQYAGNAKALHDRGG